MFGLCYNRFFLLGKPSDYHTPQLQFHDVIVGPVIYRLRVTGTHALHFNCYFSTRTWVSRLPWSVHPLTAGPYSSYPPDTVTPGLPQMASQSHSVKLHCHSVFASASSSHSNHFNLPFLIIKSTSSSPTII